MLGDLLSDTLASIEEYQGEFPGSYTDFREEIEHVKLAMARLLIRLDTPPEMTVERWAEGMARLGETDPVGLRGLMANRVYHVRREQAAESLGRDHPMLVRLSEAEAACADCEAGPARATGAHADPAAPE